MTNGLPPPPPPAPPPPFVPPSGRAVPAARKPSSLLPLLVVGALAFFAIVAAVAIAGMVLYMNGGGFSRPIGDTPAPVVETQPTPPEPPPAETPAPEPPAPAPAPAIVERESPPAEATREDDRSRERRPRRGETVGNTLGGLPDAPPPPPPAAPVRAGGRIPNPTKIRDVRPVYPAIALQARVQGVVIIEATIDASGKVSDTRVLRSIPLLDQAALEAVRQWEYEPTLLNGEPVAVIMTVTVNFTLSRD